MERGRVRVRSSAVLLSMALLAGPAASPALAAEPNDEPDAAVVVRELPFTAEQSTVEATANVADPSPRGAECSVGAHSTVWYRYTPAEAGTVLLDTATSDYDTVMVVFTESEQGLEQVSCNDSAGWRRQARVTMDMTAGTSYLVMIGAVSGTPAGTLDLTVEESPAPPLALSVSIEPATPLLPATGEVRLRGTVSCSRPVHLTLSGWVTQDGSVSSVSREIDCVGDDVAWTAVSRDRQGPALRSGPARATVVVQGGDVHDEAAAETTQALRVRGPRIAFARSTTAGGWDPFATEIFTAREGGGGQVRLTDNGVEDSHPAFSPNARRIAFTSARRGGRPSIYVMRADGSRVRRLTTGVDSMPDWSPDGKWVVFTRHFARQGQSDLMKVRVADRVTRRLTRTPARELRPAWSPDGKLIAFAKLHDAQERYGIAVIRPSATATRWLTRNPRSRAGLRDEAPTWSPTSSHVAFARETTERTSELYTVRRRGTGVRLLTGAGGQAQAPSWGADGRVLFVHDGGLATIGPDGTGLEAVTEDAVRPHSYPDWARRVIL